MAIPKLKNCFVLLVRDKISIPKLGRLRRIPKPDILPKFY
jgi:hypothetical protein